MNEWHGGAGRGGDGPDREPWACDPDAWRAAIGDVVYDVPDTAVDTVYYNCGVHPAMGGTLVIID